MPVRKKLLAVALGAIVILIGLYLWLHVGQNTSHFELIGTWKRVANPTPPPGTPPIPDLLGDILRIDGGQIAWQNGDQSISVPYRLMSSGDRLVVQADLDHDGQPDQVLLEILNGGDAPAFALGMGRAYGRWQRAAAP